MCSMAKPLLFYVLYVKNRSPNLTQQAFRERTASTQPGTKSRCFEIPNTRTLRYV